MQYDIERFVDEGYSGDDFRSGLHVVFDNESEVQIFITDVMNFNPNIQLGEINRSYYTFNPEDNYGYVYNKTLNRILRTFYPEIKVMRDKIISASDLLVSAFDFEEIVDFITMGD